MLIQSAKSLQLFYCYSPQDQGFRDELDSRLGDLKREYRITNWSDGEIVPGMSWHKDIHTRLNTANVILFLLSADFMDSCKNIEMRRVLERQEAGTACIIPIVLQSVPWEQTPFRSLHMLPSNGKPVAKWANHEAVLTDITRGIRQALDDLMVTLHTKEKWLEEEKVLYNLTDYDESLISFEPLIPEPIEIADRKDESDISFYQLLRENSDLAIYEQAVAYEPDSARNWYNKGKILDDLMRYDEALIAYSQALNLDPSLACAWNNKSAILGKLLLYEEALEACEQALDLDPQSAVAWKNMGNAFYGLMRDNEALAAYEEALHLDPSDPLTWCSKGVVLGNLMCYHEALNAYEQALQCDPHLALAWNNKGAILDELGCSDEALLACEQALRLDPNYAMAWYNKGAIFEKLGRQAEAKHCYQKANQLGYGED